MINWNIEKKFLNTEDYKLNNKVANRAAKKNFNKICLQYTHIKPKNIFSFLKMNREIWESFKGVGLDVGGGVGLVSSIIAKKINVKKIYCVEIVKNAVLKCQPIIKKKILKTKKDKVISVLGSFDNIELTKSSVDFLIAWDSLHHSSNILKTLKGLKRILKKGGKLIIIDRGHNNNTPELEIKRMQNVIYSKEFLKSNSLPTNKILTRKMNGEREYRYKDWESFFKKTGFKIKKRIVMKERHKKVLNQKNDDNIKEKIINFEIGGFEKKKIVYLLTH